MNIELKKNDEEQEKISSEFIAELRTLILKYEDLTSLNMVFNLLDSARFCMCFSGHQYNHALGIMVNMLTYEYRDMWEEAHKEKEKEKD